MGLFSKKSPAPEESPLGAQIHTDALEFQQVFGRDFKLDFSVKSLEALDKALNQVREFQESLQPQQLEGILRWAGAYLLETARQAQGGRYFFYEAEDQPILVTGQPDFEISLLGFSKVRGRVMNGPEDSIPFFYQGFQNRVQRAKPGDKAMVI